MKKGIVIEWCMVFLFYGIIPVTLLHYLSTNEADFVDKLDRLLILTPVFVYLIILVLIFYIALKVLDDKKGRHIEYLAKFYKSLINVIADLFTLVAVISLYVGIYALFNTDLSVSYKITLSVSFILFIASMFSVYVLKIKKVLK